MAKVTVVPLDRAAANAMRQGLAGEGRTWALLQGARDPIHAHLHELASGEVLRVGPMPADSVVYLWEGEVAAGGAKLPCGSSVMVERGAVAELVGHADRSRLVLFSASQEANGNTGGSAAVRLMPADRVPRYSEGPEGAAVQGGLHSDAADADCPVWLHENHLPAPAAEASPGDAERGIHSHAEDEVIFVTAGDMRLGARLYGPGTAVAIAAHTMYGFTVGPAGLSFVNFRAGLPDVIRFKNGMVIDEVGYWRDRVGRPSPITLASAA